MFLPALTAVDSQLRIERSVWRMQRIDGATRQDKANTLRRIDLLLEKRLTITSTRAPVAA